MKRLCISVDDYDDDVKYNKKWCIKEDERYKESTESKHDTPFMEIFFASLLPYEYTRFLYAYSGIRQCVMCMRCIGHCDRSDYDGRDTINNIYNKVLHLWIRLSLAYNDGRTTRHYAKCDAPRLYDDVGAHYRTHCIHNVVQKATRLQRRGVPRHLLLVVTRDTVVRYDDFANRLTDDTLQWIAVGGSHQCDYRCMDARNVTKVKQLLGWSHDTVKKRYLVLRLIKSWPTRVLEALIRITESIADTIDILIGVDKHQQR